MLATKLKFVGNILYTRNIHNSVLKCNKKNPENPFARTIRVLRDDIVNAVKSFDIANESYLSTIFPRHTDILIIGGGAIGTSIAYYLKDKTGPKGISVTIIEKDPLYTNSSSVLSIGELRQQYSLPENIQMSLYGAEFLRTLKRKFGSQAEVFYTPNGYLTLANEEMAQHLIDNNKLQAEYGATNILLGSEQLKERFPWLDVTGVELGCLGLEKEGWFNPWELMCILKQQAMLLGTQYVTAEAVDFTFLMRHDMIIEGVHEGPFQGLDELIVKTPDGELKPIKFAYCVIAAGTESEEIAKRALIGTGPGMLSIPMSLEKRKRHVYCFDCNGEGPGLDMPMVADHSGIYFRRDGLGGTYLAGLSTLPGAEPQTASEDYYKQYFDDKVLPLLSKRVPGFKSAKIHRAWGGLCDFISFDDNGIVSPHPYYHNLYLATGFSGHGIQQAPAVGRAVAEMLIDGGFQTLDLTRLSFDRLIVDKPMYESCVV